jgi:AcrR family transcriptional regulator
MKKMSTLKQHILTSALELFLKHGYAAVSVNQIVNKAGVSKGGFYHHFKSKEELLVIFFDLWLNKDVYSLIDFLKSSRLSTKEKVERIFAHFVPRKDQALDLFENRVYGEDVYSLLVLEGINRSEVLKQKARQAFDDLIREYEKLLRAGKRRGDIKEDVTVHSAALSLVTMHEGLHTLYLYDPDLDMNRESSLMYRLYWDSIKR